MSTNKPMPMPTSISAPFWEGLKAGRILMQHCGACDQWTFYPRRHCSHCWSSQVEFREVSGEGRLYTFTVARVPTLPEFAGPEPQLMAVVELDEGVRLNTTLVGVSADEVEVGMRVKPVRARVAEDGTVLLRFTSAHVDLEEVDEVPRQPAATAPAEDARPVRQIPLSDETALQSLVSEEFSPWSNQVLVDQDMINQFAELSGDRYWIHTDPERARKEGPFGGTIAHGALVQILMSRMQVDLGYEITGFTNMVNYGSERLRFPSPVPAGSLIHARGRVKSVERSRRGTQLVLELNVHVVGQERPAVINDLIILYM
ncbi:OB-fold domain-containing protein [Marinobacter sp. X15-166B]|uniref:bifunctional OB-fold nucleic acid binding domain-containing protein/MaoC family dehydratase n=1 Tax=Marinobacter sp. X15-166B TaxID=1897620 RepID=UPI00085C293A|nr:OB-fold domain-containing protein [Marinobacter sp. X15-166B]OEY66314.1 acyl dehydratase [Marinobacter sp. X15-166B]